jgi:hypothetical protein
LVISGDAHDFLGCHPRARLGDPDEEDAVHPKRDRPNTALCAGLAMTGE